MVKLPEVVSVETEEVLGQTVVKQKYADGSYGIDLGYGTVEIHYPDFSVRTFGLKEKDGNDYYLKQENLIDGTVRKYNGDGIKYYEKLSNGEERTWDIFFQKAHIKKEVIPGEVTREYHLTGNYSKKCRLLPGTEYNYLLREEFANGNIVEYYADRHEKIKKSEKLEDGVVRSFYRDGTLMAEIFQDGYEVGYYQINDKKVKKSEKLTDGTERTYYENGQLEKEKLTDGTERTYNGNGQLEKERLTDGTERTYYEDGIKKTEISPNGEVKEWDNKGNIIHEEYLSSPEVTTYITNRGNMAYATSRTKNVVDYKYDADGKLIYHAVNGVEDTVSYLAKQKVAAKRIEKEIEQEAKTGKPTILPKMNKLEKAYEMLKAKREVKKDLNR